MQADILQLNKLDKYFDIIESGGVLHHMKDPLAGWKVLTNCLKPYGLMKIALYSELAREHIIKIRKEIEQLNIGYSDLEIKNFRKKMIESDRPLYKIEENSHDFYSLSSVRDLLFHVQEHRFSLVQIREYLKKLGLHFCGFEGSKIINHFNQFNGEVNDLYDLDKGHNFEQSHPRVFAGMYQFWCQKIN